MDVFLSLTLLSFFITSALIVPFINMLYNLKFQRTREKAEGAKKSLFDKLHGHKIGTPVGGGLLVIFVTLSMSLILPPSYGIPFDAKLIALMLSLLLFGALGLYDDIHKFFQFKQEGIWGMKMRYKFAIQWVIGFILGGILYYGLNYDNLYITGLGNFHLGPAYIPFAAFVIVAFSNAFNITDGLDGLAGGLFVICLFGFLAIATYAVSTDPTLQMFLGILIGSMFAFLYFNIYPARIWMGDVGALAFGASLGVIALITGKVFAMMIIGGVFILEVFTSAAQLLSLKYRKKKIWRIAPLHLYLQSLGWEEPKIVMRFWLMGGIFALFGVWLSLL